MFILNDLGWDDGFSAAFESLDDNELVPARVAAQHRGGYDVLTEGGERRVRLTGRLRHEAASAAELPAVGDWVALRDETIHAVLPRRSAFSRKAAWAPTEQQVLAANLDAIFIVSALDGDLNMRRLERFVGRLENERESVACLGTLSEYLGERGQIVHIASGILKLRLT